MRTLAIDPGSTSGWCFITNLKSEIQLGQITLAPARAARKLYDIAKGFRAQVIVIEDFILRQMTMSRELLDPVRVMAGIDVLNDGKKGIPIVYQQASLAKTTFTDERLRLMGLWGITTGKPHARDALRHGLTYLRRQGLLDDHE